MHPPFEMREPQDPSRGHQPKYESLVMLGDDSFALTARLPSGETIEIPLGRKLPLGQFWVDPDDTEP